MLPPRRLRRRETGTLRTWENDGGRSNLYVLFGAVLGWLLLAVSLCRASNVGFHLKMEVCDDNGNYTDCYNIIKGEVELDSQATTASLAAWSPPVKLPDDSLANVKIQDPAGRGFSLFFEKEPVMFENPLIESPATLWWSYHEATMHFGALEMTCPMGNVPPTLYQKAPRMNGINLSITLIGAGLPPIFRYLHTTIGVGIGIGTASIFTYVTASGTKEVRRAFLVGDRRQGPLLQRLQ
eukprot:GHVU01148213.1.p1 GENE.GHVU01148213.1~~GHVU01148213.1.p1  ORF type:complete len:238 (+),score=8.71 GHVU01148213.1:222-935(+)